MNITKRISKFLLIAALAVPAWTSLSAQNRAVPPEEEVKVTPLEQAPKVIVQGESSKLVASSNVNRNAISPGSNVFKIKAGNTVGLPVKLAGKPMKSSVKRSNAKGNVATKADIPDGYVEIVFHVENVWNDGSGYQLLIGPESSLTSATTWSDIYSAAVYSVPENADYSSTGNATYMIVEDTQSIMIPAGTYDYVVTNPTPGDKTTYRSTYATYTFNTGGSYEFHIYSNNGSETLDINVTEPTSDVVGVPTNLEASPDATTATISWVSGENNESWNLRYREVGDVYNKNRFWDFESESQIDDFTMLDIDGDGYNWGRNGGSASLKVQSGSYIMQSASYLNNIGALTPNNWLITPKVKLGGSVSFYACGQDNSDYSEKFGVYVFQGDTWTSVNDFAQVGNDRTTGSSMTKYTFDLSSYSGPGYIAIVHHNTTNMFFLNIDDIEVLVPDALPDNEWIYVNDVTNPYTITGLTTGTTYEVQVQGVGNNTTTDWTASEIFTTLAPTQSLDFGTVNAGSGSSKTMTAKIANDGNEAVQATITVNPNPPFSVENTTVTLAANTLTSIPVTFTPSEARNYNGTLTVVAGDVTTTIALKGVGNMSGPEAVRDSAFYAGITYNWTDSEGTSHTSRLDEIATDPDQIIAMLTEVYTNKTIPGSFKRGYSTSLGSEEYDDVYYGGVGTLTHSGSNYSSASSYTYNPSYGWNIPTDTIKTDSYTWSSSYGYTSYFAYMNPNQYKPYNEGLTLLLVETDDEYASGNLDSSISDKYQQLRDYISKAYKSVRVVTQALRTGDGEARGTLFNIDCDKMNKFFLMSKGEMRFTHNSYMGKSNMTYSGIDGNTYYYKMQDDKCQYPCFVYSGIYYTSSGYNWTTSNPVNGFVDEFIAAPFYHMFEQYSPVANDASSGKADIYRDLVNMDSFGVIHDCMGVSYMGHQFMMYGTESGAADCQDVRDLMFFVPDYRMKYWTQTVGGTTTSRDNTVSDWKNYQKFMNYNQDHAPTMGLYVIIQDSVEAVTRADDYFKLKLTWDSNMDEFLPGEKQEYQLYQVVTDEFGVSKWVPVYKRNAQGQYWNPTTNAWQADTVGAERVVLTLDPSNTKKTYAEVYEMRDNSGRIVTYAVRGQDTGHFLSLQMSNEESYFIPGKDPAEMALMSSATVYSRYEAQNENNCYSNKLLLKSSPQTIKASYLPNNSTMTINRTHRVKENGQSVEVTDTIATLIVTNSGSNQYFTVSGPVLDASVKDLFPKGTDNLTAGYHANTLTNGNQIAYTTEKVGGTEYMNFDIALWDNFVADVSKNEHPGLYTYQLTFNTATPFTGLNGQTNEAYSNIIPVFVYKTDSQINEPLTLEQVNGDTDCSDAYKPGDVEFSAQVQLSSKSEILRYDAYRWNEGAERSIVLKGGSTDEDEEDVDPNGIAGNQGDSYSVTMNAIGTDDYYVGSAVPVTDAAPQNWAKFVDYYPAKLVNGGAFTYAPVVELFTKGYQAGSTTAVRGDYNTYGGPLKTTAVGKMELEIPDNLNTAGNPFMSTYKWLDGEDWCAYYKIPVKFKVLGIPEGYELYKIRAWRDVDTKILREELTSRQDRIASNYLFEELTYGDALGDGYTMSKENLYKNVDGTVYSYELGRRAVENSDADSNIQGETHATFGALRINTKDNQPYSIDNLEATIKVRAYFTKAENPILNDPIYVVANNGSGWNYDTPLATLKSEDGSTYSGTVTIPEGEGQHYFMFSKQLGSSWENNNTYIFGADWGNGDAVVDPTWDFVLRYWANGTKPFRIAPGTYNFTINNHVKSHTDAENAWWDNKNWFAGTLSITKTTAKASSRDLTAADYGYYVADGEVEFNSNMFNQIITGVTDVTTNSTREVMSVSYVNTIGQVSSTPWKGVNMVVTRYTDGSTSTTKVMK